MPGYGLAAESFAFLLAGEGGLRQQLEGDVAIEPLLPRPVDDAHGAPPETAGDFIPLADRLGGCFLGRWFLAEDGGGKTPETGAARDRL